MEPVQIKTMLIFRSLYDVIKCNFSKKKNIRKFEKFVSDTTKQQTENSYISNSFVIRIGKPTHLNVSCVVHFGGLITSNCDSAVIFVHQK